MVGYAGLKIYTGEAYSTNTIDCFYRFAEPTAEPKLKWPADVFILKAQTGNDVDN
jgi:hypothetical protein